MSHNKNDCIIYMWTHTCNTASSLYPVQINTHTSPACTKQRTEALWSTGRGVNLGLCQLGQTSSCCFTPELRQHNTAPDRPPSPQLSLLQSSISTTSFFFHFISLCAFVAILHICHVINFFAFSGYCPINSLNQIISGTCQADEVHSAHHWHTDGRSGVMLQSLLYY